MSSGSILPGGQRAPDAPGDQASEPERTALGKYQILRPLGAGGMGTVYLAVDTHLKRTVALKVLHKDRATNETLVRRFEAEAQASAQLKHENIVTVYDAGQTDGCLYIALEYVEGTDIHELVAKRGAIPLKRSVDFIKQILYALDHLHKRGIVHRDIKPSNLLVTKDGTVKLTDLGLARAVDESLESNITREGTTVGTVDYMAPEQARNSQSADIRSDIYSLGCTWYQMLTGEPPFPEGSVTNKLYSHISKPRPDPRAHNGTIPEEVVAIMQRMMARKSSDRYQTPTEVITDLDNMGSSNKRLDELFRGDGDDDPRQASTPSPARGTPARGTPTRGGSPRGTPPHGSPLPLPPRHAPNPRADESRAAPPAEIEREAAERRLPARHVPTPGRATPADRNQPPSEQPAPPPRLKRVRHPEELQQPRKSVRAEPLDPVEPDVPDVAEYGSRSRSRSRSPETPSRPAARSRSQSPSQSAPEPPSRPHYDRDRPVEVSSDSVPDWQPLAIKAATVVGAVAAIGALIWFALPYLRSDSSNARTSGVARNPFDPTADVPQATATGEEGKKGEAVDAKGKQKGDEKSALKGKAGANGKSGKAVLVVDTQKPAAEGGAETSGLVPGRPAERAAFPPWIADLWNPNAASPANGSNTLSTITVGRSGKDPAQVASLASALAGLPPEGGVIELRGPGPFVLPPTRIDKHRQVIITGVRAAGRPNGTAESGATATKSLPLEEQPVIVLTPGSASTAESGIVANDSSLTFYGLHLVAFADEFKGDQPLRLIDVRSGDLVLQKCSLTWVGSRVAPTSALSISAATDERPPRVLLDRTVVRGSGLTPVEASTESLDLLAINSLFVTGKAPALALRSSNSGSASARKPGESRTSRFFSCTTSSDESTVSLQSGTDAAEPPSTRFQVLNSVFGVASQPQAAMIALNNWPVTLGSADSPARFKNITWASESFLARGWQDNLVASDARLRLSVQDARNWGAFWGDSHASVDYLASPFAPVSDFAAVEPGQFKSESILSHDSAGDTAPPGCDTTTLAVSNADMIRRASVFSRRPQLPPDQTVESKPTPIREINLDGSKAREDLAKTINQADWPNGTRFLVKGTGKKICSPLRITNRSATIEFVDTPPLILFDDHKLDGPKREAFITVVGGSLDLVNATMRIEPSTRGGTQRLLDVRGGNFSIRNSSLIGPPRENPGYEGLIRFSSSLDESLAAAGEENTSLGTVRNSFLSSTRNLLSGDLSSQNLIFENSFLVAGDRVFDVNVPAGKGPSAIDLRSCTLAAGGQYFHLNAKTGAGAGKPARIVLENTLFAPPVSQADGAAGHAALLEPNATDSLQERADWWEAGNAYSDLITLPGAKTAAPSDKVDGSADPLKPWQQMAGPMHIVRSIAQTGAVLLPGDLPQVKDIQPSSLRLKPEALAATWSETGKAVGADLTAQPVQPVLQRPTPSRPPKPVPTTKAAPAKKPSRPASGI